MIFLGIVFGGYRNGGFGNAKCFLPSALEDWGYPRDIHGGYPRDAEIPP